MMTGRLASEDPTLLQKENRKSHLEMVLIYTVHINRKERENRSARAPSIALKRSEPAGRLRFQARLQMSRETTIQPYCKYTPQHTAQAIGQTAAQHACIHIGISYCEPTKAANTNLSHTSHHFQIISQIRIWKHNAQNGRQLQQAAQVTLRQPWRWPRMTQWQHRPCQPWPLSLPWR